MEIRNIVPVMERDFIKKNKPLADILANVATRDEKIVEYAIFYASTGVESIANSFIGLIWPSILEEDEFNIRGIEGGRNDGQYFVDLTDKTIRRKEELDILLTLYAEAILNLTLRLLNETGTQKSVFYNLAYELLSATHLMCNQVSAEKYFSAFMGYFAGYHKIIESCGMLEHSPETLRQTLKDVPALKRGEKTFDPDQKPDPKKYKLENNLITYLNAIDARLKNESSGNQVRAINQFIRIVCISACQTDLLRSVYETLRLKSRT